MADTPQLKTIDGTTSHVRTYAKDVATLTGKPLPTKVENVTAPVPAPKPVIPPPSVTPVVLPLPKDPEQEAALTRIKAKVAAPAVEKPSPIHTYKSDFADHVQEEKASPLSVLAAQQDAAQPAPQVLAPKKKLPTELIGGVLLIIIGIAAVAAAYLYATRDRIVEELFVPSLIFADERVALTGSVEELRTALAHPPEADALSEGGVLLTYITYATTSADGKTSLTLAASGKDLIDALRLPAPDILLRNVLPESTVGLVRAGETRPFFILKVESYERTYAGMLTWEATLEQDLSVFYPSYPVENASTTLPAFRLSFVDAVVENRDVRVLKDADNRTVLLYGYRDKETLVIARNEAAFSELLRRLAATRAQ